MNFSKRNERQECCCVYDSSAFHFIHQQQSNSDLFKISRLFQIFIIAAACPVSFETAACVKCWLWSAMNQTAGKPWKSSGTLAPVRIVSFLTISICTSLSNFSVCSVNGGHLWCNLTTQLKLTFSAWLLRKKDRIQLSFWNLFPYMCASNYKCIEVMPMTLKCILACGRWPFPLSSHSLRRSLTTVAPASLHSRWDGWWL